MPCVADDRIATSSTDPCNVIYVYVVEYNAIKAYNTFIKWGFSGGLEHINFIYIIPNGKIYLVLNLPFMTSAKVPLY